MNNSNNLNNKKYLIPNSINQDSFLLVGSNQDDIMYCIDPLTGSQIHSYKTNTSTLNGISIVPSKEMIITIQDNKLLINLYHWSKDTPFFKCHIPEKMGPILVSKCGNYCFAGSISGKIYAWYIPSGELLNVWDAHYKKITCLEKSYDNSFIFSGGEDGIINAWKFTDIIDTTLLENNHVPHPLYSWSDHTLPITSIYLGLGDRFYSSSLDRTCKIWSFNSTEPLYSVTCPSGIRVCKVDLYESRLFLGCDNAMIYSLDLRLSALSSNITPHSNIIVAGMDVIEPVLSEPYEGHTSPILALDTSFCGQYMISGSEDGDIRIWDTGNECKKSIRTISIVKGPITSLQLVINYEMNQVQFTPRPFRKYIGSINDKK